MPTSNPPPTDTPSFLEGLALESIVDLSSIPSVQTSHTCEENEGADHKASKKRSQKEVDPDEVTSSLSGSAKRPETNKPIPVVPISSMPPAGTSKVPRLFGLSNTR